MNAPGLFVLNESRRIFGFEVGAERIVGLWFFVRICLFRFGLDGVPFVELFCLFLIQLPKRFRGLRRGFKGFDKDRSSSY